MYERIHGILTLRDLINEVKLTAIKDTKIQGLHQTLLPISASNTAIGPAFSHPEVFGTRWFRRIVVLIFGMTLLSTIDYIYVSASTTLVENEGFIVLFRLSIYVGVWLRTSDRHLRVPLSSFSKALISVMAWPARSTLRQTSQKDKKRDRKVAMGIAALFNPCVPCYFLAHNNWLTSAKSVTYAGRLELALKGTRYD